MRKRHDGEKGGGEMGKKRKKIKTENCGHYVIASSRPPKRQPLECRTLMPISGQNRKRSHKKNYEILDIVQIGGGGMDM